MEVDKAALWAFEQRLLKGIVRRGSPVDRTQPAIVCLCGSCRFRAEFEKQNALETLAGKIVLSVGVFKTLNGEPLTQEQKELLDALHKRKIDLADEVLILNVGGYIGESTRSELEYAKAHGKLVRFLEPVIPSKKGDEKGG